MQEIYIVGVNYANIIMQDFFLKKMSDFNQYLVDLSIISKVNKLPR